MANTYSNTPLGNEILSVSQPLIQANFNYLVNTLGTSNANNGDHQISQGGNDNTPFEGRHRQVCFLDRNGSPLPTATGFADSVDSVVYSNAENLYLNTITSAAVAYQLTSTSSNAGENAKFGAATNGWIFLPGGIILNYGTTTLGLAPTAVSFSKSFSNTPTIWYGAPFHAEFSSTSFVQGIVISSLTNTGFTFTTISTIATNVPWIAFGKA